MHPVKELHYFDTLCGMRAPKALQEFSLRQIMREVDHIVQAKEFRFVNPRYRCYLRTNRLLASKPVESIAYRDLYRPMLARYTLFGESTPEYMRLAEADIQRMCATIGSDALILLLCRDPVQRFLSSVKLFNRYNGLQMSDEDASRWVGNALRAENSWLLAQDGYNDYLSAIERYRKYFDRVVAIPYDQLILDPETVARQISATGDIRISTDAFVAGINKSSNRLGDGFELAPEILECLSLRYATARQAICDHLGMELSL